MFSLTFVLLFYKISKIPEFPSIVHSIQFQKKIECIRYHRSRKDYSLSITKYILGRVGNFQKAELFRESYSHFSNPLIITRIILAIFSFLLFIEFSKINSKIRLAEMREGISHGEELLILKAFARNASFMVIKIDFMAASNILENAVPSFSISMVIFLEISGVLFCFCGQYFDIP